MVQTQDKQVWEAVLGSLQLEVTRPSYETWLKDTVGVGYRDGAFVVGVPNGFVAEMLEKRMYSLISQAVERVTNEQVDLRFQVIPTSGGANRHGGGLIRHENGGAEPPLESRAPDSPPSSAFGYRSSYLNPRYTFDTFIVGKSNELAHAAAKAVADRPSEVYNPLVMYSDAGLGKTHLLHAIGSQVQALGLSLIYTTTEEFTNDYVKAIRDGENEAFRNRYRGIDMLLLDDVQFLIGKEQTQEGFFHSFNALHMNNRQIVITSDRPVTALTVLEERVRSRLAGGLVVDIQPPDMETRLAILRFKAELTGHDVPPDALQFLAERVYRNIRELEGTLNRIVAHSQLTQSSITLEMVKRTADQVSPAGTSPKVSDQLILDTVANYYGMSVDEIKGRKRDRKTAQARQVCMYLLRQMADLRPTAIGRILGGKDHSTVVYGYERVATRLDTDRELRRAIIDIRHELVRP